MMTKKHFKEFANALSEIDDEVTRLKVGEVICNILRSDNPRFDEARFWEWIRRVRAGEDLRGLR